MVATANTKMIVRPASRMFSAISFGVFCRSAPSTSAIMRSRKVEPCAAVIRTLIQSDSTRVPPVTAERSPPLSRMTGADSPVIADSSTEAMPSTTSPSLGIRSPASTSTMSPCFSSGAGTVWYDSAFRDASRLAGVSVRALRRVAACALPRPSATASAKLANSTVSHSQKTIWKVKPIGLPWINSRTRMMVVSAATISTTNITGFLISTRGLSLRTDSQSAGPRIAGSSTEDCEPRILLRISMAIGLAACVEEGAGVHREVLDDRPEGNGWEEDQTTGDRDDAHHQADEQRPIGREGAGGSRHDLLADQRTGDRHHRDDHQEAADEHREAQRIVPERHVGGQASEGAAVVAGGRDVGIEHLGEAVRAGVVRGAGSDRQDRRNRGEAQHRERQGRNGKHRHLRLFRFELLAEIFRRASDHQPGDEHRHDDEEQH